MFDIAFNATGKATAQTELATRNSEQLDPMTDDLLAAVQSVIAQSGSTTAVGVSVFGDNGGRLNVTVAPVIE